MSSLHPVSSSRHGDSRWRRYSGYSFSATTSVARLAAAEVAKAAVSLPLAFIENKGSWVLAAVLGLRAGQNLYVSPTGQWVAAYIPAVFRAYPFQIGQDEAGQFVLCVDEESGLVGGGQEGELFFTQEGELSDAVRQVWNFVQQTANSEQVLSNACGQLHTAGVIEPWPISIQDGDVTQQVTGLWRINEAALNELDDIDYGQLRRAGAVGVAYAQLLSTANLADLGQLAEARAQAEAAERARAEVKPMIMLPEDSSIDWDWSKVGKP